jgi:tRNA modification GTPase
MVIVDTIIACTTPIGRSGIAMLRISGSDSLKIATALCKNTIVWSDRKAILSSIYNQKDEPVDQAIFIAMKGPRSFTGEDVVEISCHGNPLIVDEIIVQAIRCGARLARNGEFTRRALENRKLSLLQAEALNELIHSTSLPGAQIAQAGLAGQVDSNELEIREELLDICAEIEAKMDYPQEDLSYVDDQGIVDALSIISGKAQQAATAWRGNRIRLHGAKVAILGPVNAGKSSLFNHMVGSKRAIVNSRPGTTRDIIERRVSLNGIEVCFFDTAGIRFETTDPIEAEGIQMGLELATEADLCLLVLPVNQQIGTLKQIQKKIQNECIVVASYSDLDVIPSFEFDHLISNLTGKGLDDLRNDLQLKLGVNNSQENKWIALSQRQYELFLSISSHIDMASKSLLGFLGPAVAAEEITQALERLAMLRGENARENILDRLFSRFCIGK